jgi:hypothetical protein
MSKNTMMSRFMSSAARVLDGTVVPPAPGASAAPAPAPAAEPDEGGPAPVSQEAIEAGLETAHAAGKVEGTAEGTKAEATRWHTVMSSDAGKANYSMATFMLNANPGSTAESIIGHLADNPAPAAVAAKPAPVTTALTDTPIVELGGAPANNGDSGLQATTAENDKLWDASRERLAANGQFRGMALAPATTASTQRAGH